MNGSEFKTAEGGGEADDCEIVILGETHDIVHGLHPPSLSSPETGRRFMSFDTHHTNEVETEKVL
jgi:hypothetical protein